MTKPVFQHDTDAHMFAGTIDGKYDVWYGPAHNECVIRHGNDGHEYRCVEASMALSMPSMYRKAASMIHAKLNELAHSLLPN